MEIAHQTATHMILEHLGSGEAVWASGIGARVGLGTLALVLLVVGQCTLTRKAPMTHFAGVAPFCFRTMLHIIVCFGALATGQAFVTDGTGAGSLRGQSRI